MALRDRSTLSAPAALRTVQLMAAVNRQLSRPTVAMYLIPLHWLSVTVGVLDRECYFVNTNRGRSFLHRNTKTFRELRRLGVVFGKIEGVWSKPVASLPDFESLDKALRSLQCFPWDIEFHKLEHAALALSDWP